MTPRKKKEKKQASSLRARALEHFLTYGETNVEGDEYWKQAEEIISKAELGVEEYLPETRSKLRKLLAKRVNDHASDDKKNQSIPETSDIVAVLQLIRSFEDGESSKQEWAQRGKQYFDIILKCLYDCELVAEQHEKLIVTRKGEKFLRLATEEG